MEHQQVVKLFHFYQVIFNLNPILLERLKHIEYTTIAIQPIGKIGKTVKEKGSINEPFFILYKSEIRREL